MPRVLSYLHRKIGIIKPRLNAINLSVIHWWVDVPYGTHPYLKGKIGETASIGKLCITSALKKKKVNTTISIIREVVGMYEEFSQVFQTKAFMQNQGF